MDKETKHLIKLDRNHARICKEIFELKTLKENIIDVRELNWEIIGKGIWESDLQK